VPIQISFLVTMWSQFKHKWTDKMSH